MKNNLKTAMKMTLAICMAFVMVCSVASDALAAGFTKSFTKSYSIKGGQQCLIWVGCAQDQTALVKVEISTTSKNKDLNIQGVTPNATDFAQLKAKKKKSSYTTEMSGDLNSIYVTNYATGKVKVKIKVSTKEKVIKFVKKETIKEIA